MTTASALGFSVLMGLLLCLSGFVVTVWGRSKFDTSIYFRRWFFVILFGAALFGCGMWKITMWMFG